MAEVPVKVFVRVRPLLELERLKSSEECVRLVSEDQLVLGNDRSFRFDYIFPQDTTQSTVYQSCVSPLLSSCLDGYNSTVLAYGQTGSGKSFTLGSETAPHGYQLAENRGLIPRALDELFHLVGSRPPSAQGRYRITLSYIEIYKEELRDLLDGGGVVQQPLVIREDEQGNTVLVGALEVEVNSADEALGWLEAGNTARVTAATQMNQRSSRSHAVFTLHIEQRCKVDQGDITKGVDSQAGGGEVPKVEDVNENPGQQEMEQFVSGKFHFVDLAGSERVSKTGNKGERFKESVHINSGLLALGNVISALGDPKRKSLHVPYRESKITRLLKDSLGGNARTAMIACLSPAMENFPENLNTLKYAKRARNIRNRPVVNKDPAVSRLLEMRKEIAALRDELHRTQLSYASKPTTAATNTLHTVDSSVMVELSDVEGHMTELEAELQEARRRSQHYYHALSSVRDLIGQLGTEGAVVTSDLSKQIKHWLEHIERIEGGPPSDTNPAASSSILTERAMETICLLRRELEQCHADLQTDEELFAEKVDELSEIQSAYSQLVREKERLEEMWLAAQEKEGLLQSEVFQLKEHLSSMTRELAERDRRDERGGERKRDSLGAESTQNEGETDSLREIKPGEVFGELESSSQHHAIGEGGEAGEGGGGGGGERVDRFTATRSLLQGKVKTASLKDFSEEAVTDSLITLNSCLAQHLLPLMKKNSGSSQTGEPEAAPSELSELRPMTPLETSLSDREPLQSKSSGGHAHSPPTSSLGGTYKVEDGGKILQVGGAMGVALRRAEELELLNESAVESRRQLNTAEEKLSRAEEEHRNLNLKIRMKEELIRELVKSSRSMKELNQSYVAKIHQLEKEASTVQRELARTQELMMKQRNQSSGSHEERQLVKLVEEHKKKLAMTEKKLKSLQRKQKEAQRLVGSEGRRERRIDELESGIERLRNQQQSMKRRLKKQAERKQKLENDLQKYEVRIKSLQAHSEQQSKVLKRKTEEAAVAQRKLRQLNSGSRPSSHKEGESSERAWLDEEVEKVLQRKKDIESLEKELAARERVIAEREALMAERDSLEAEKIRSSHSAARDVVRLSQQINTLEDSIRLRQEGGGVKGRGKSGSAGDKEQEIVRLTKERPSHRSFSDLYGVTLQTLPQACLQYSREIGSPKPYMPRTMRQFSATV